MYVLGFDAKLYRGAAGARAATEMTNVKDVNVDMSEDETDTTTRATKGWKSSAGTLKAGTVDWEMMYDTTNADYQAMLNAFLKNEAVALFVSDGAGSGLDADFRILDFSQSQPLNEAMTVKVKASITAALRSPKYVNAYGTEEEEEEE